MFKQKPKTKIAGNTKKQKKEDEEVYVCGSEKNEFDFCPLSTATKERLQKLTMSTVVANESKDNLHQITGGLHLHREQELS